MVLLGQPVRGSAAYSGCFACQGTHRCSKAQAGKVKAQAKQDKAQAERTKRKPDRVPRTISKVSQKVLAKKLKHLKCDSTVQVGKITSSLRSALARSRLLEVHNTECEGEIQQVCKNDGGKSDR